MTDVDEMRDLLTYANYAKVAAALRVSRNAVSAWARGKDVTPYRVRQVRDLLRPSTAGGDVITRAEVMTLYAELLGEIRANRAVVQAAFAGADAEWLGQVMDRIGAELSPPVQRHDGAAEDRRGATEQQPGAAGRS